MSPAWLRLILLTHEPVTRFYRRDGAHHGAGAVADALGFQPARAGPARGPQGTRCAADAPRAGRHRDDRGHAAGARRLVAARRHAATRVHRGCRNRLRRGLG